MTRPFGLDIGSSTMKAVYLTKQNNSYGLIAAITAPTPAKGMLSDAPLDREAMARAIKKLVIEGRINTQFVTVSLPENQVYTKVLEMPILSDKELGSAIYYEAEQYIPVPLSTITLDWKVLSRPPAATADAKMQILLVGAATELINKYQKILSMAGLTPIAVEPEILSAIRPLILDKNFPNSMVMNIGAISSSLAIIKDGVVIFTYSMPTGGVAINRAIAADFGFTGSQAEEYKRVYGVSKQVQGAKLGQATIPVLQAIVNEVKKAINYYAEKYKSDHPIQQILLLGGSAKLPGIDAFFTQNCGIQTSIANPWHILGKQPLPQEIIAADSDFTIAVGLAMRDYE